MFKKRKLFCLTHQSIFYQLIKRVNKNQQAVISAAYTNDHNKIFTYSYVLKMLQQLH